MAYKSKGPSMKQGGTFMSKHNSSYMHKQNLLNDMPVDDHAGSPMHQTEQDEQNVLNRRQANIDHHKQLESGFYDKVKNYQANSQEEVDKINKKLKELNKNTNLRINRYNKSLDSIKKVRNQRFEDLFK